jgi:hypothetical protein
LLEDIEEGIANNKYRGTNRMWVDRASGALLKWETIGISNSQQSSWQTTSLQLP